MPNEKDTRKWWLKKTNQGLCVMGLGTILQLIPFTALVAPTVISMGMILGGFGLSRRIDNK